MIAPTPYDFSRPQVGLEIGLQDDEFDSALDYTADQGWFHDAEVADNASWVSLTPAGESAGESG